MKKLQKLQNRLATINTELAKVSFERKDTSYRRSGGYYGTDKADTSGCIVIATYHRTRYLNTYICVPEQYRQSVEEQQNIMAEISAFMAKQWAKESIQKCIDRVNADIADGTVFTNYAKIFIEGNNHIYMAHPYYQHSDYNKWQAMPNTAKHRKVAAELNAKLIEAGVNLG